MNSLLEDLIGFARENIEKAGVSFAESNQRDRNLINAYKSGAPVDPAQRQAMAEEYINQASPMSTVGGMIKPSTWRGKFVPELVGIKNDPHIGGYSPEAKTIMTKMANDNPEMFAQVLKHPRDVHMKVRERGMSPFTDLETGGLIETTPTRADITIARDHAGKKAFDEGYHVGLHELAGHYLQNKRVSKADPADAGTIGMLMQDLIPYSYRGSLDRNIRQYNNIQRFIREELGYPTLPPAGSLKEAGPLLEEIAEREGVDAARMFTLPKLRQRIDTSPYKMNRGQKYDPNMPKHILRGDSLRDPAGNSWNIRSENVEDYLNRAMMDEALAHLTQVQRIDASTPQLRQLGKDLGVTIKGIKGIEERLNEVVAQPLGTPGRLDAIRDLLRRTLHNVRDELEPGEQMPTSLEEFVKRFPGRLPRKIDPDAPKGWGSVSVDQPPRNPRDVALTPSEQELYRIMPPNRPDIPREKFSPGAMEFWKLLEENPTAAKQQFKRELLARWNAIQQRKVKERR